MDSKDTDRRAGTTGEPSDEFLSAAEEDQGSFLGELRDFLLHSKKWWLTPIIIALLLIGILAIVGSSSLASLIYPLF